MLQLQVLTGKRSGSNVELKRLPCRVGRGKSCDLQLTDPGIWDSHVELVLEPREGIFVTVFPHAKAYVNGQPVDRARLRNGDILELGAVRMQFWLGTARQKRFLFSENLTWASVVAVVIAEVVLAYWLLWS